MSLEDVPHGDEGNRFRSALTEWGRRWNLNCPWVTDRAVYILWTWHQSPGTKGVITQLPAGNFAPPDVAHIKPPEWHPWLESEEEADELWE